MTKIPRRASRYLTRWQRFKRWWRVWWQRYIVIHLEEEEHYEREK